MATENSCDPGAIRCIAIIDEILVENAGVKVEVSDYDADIGGAATAITDMENTVATSVSDLGNCNTLYADSIADRSAKISQIDSEATVLHNNSIDFDTDVSVGGVANSLLDLKNKQQNVLAAVMAVKEAIK